MKTEQHCIVYYKTVTEAEKSGYAAQKAASMEILRYAFRDFFGIALREDRIRRMPGGKPWYDGLPNCFFNISHCASAVAVAAAWGPVGVDVEGMRRVKRRTVERCCSEKEAAYVFGAKKAAAKGSNELSEAEAGRFLKLWTLKESHVKMTGEGLRALPDGICFDLPGFREISPGILIWEEPGQYLSCLHTRAGSGITMALTLQHPVPGADAGILWIPYAPAAGAG